MIILDSSLLVAHRNATDAHHRAAAAAVPRIVAGDWGPALLPEYVFLEVVTVVAARQGLAVAVALGQELLDAREIEFVPCSEHFLSAFDLFRSQTGTQLSLADATIVVIARKRGAEYVATFDHDFHKIEGLSVVP